MITERLLLIALAVAFVQALFFVIFRMRGEKEVSRLLGLFYLRRQELLGSALLSGFENMSASSDPVSLVLPYLQYCNMLIPKIASQNRDAGILVSSLVLADFYLLRKCIETKISFEEFDSLVGNDYSRALDFHKFVSNKNNKIKDEKAFLDIARRFGTKL